MAFQVTVVIPTFQSAQLICSAVRAALEQSHPHVLVTVVDDGSTDGTRSALQQFLTHPRFLYLGLPANLGTAQAKNVGLALTSGDGWSFHDADDRPHPDKILQQARVMQAGVEPDPVLHWQLMREGESRKRQVSCVLTHHELIQRDGRRHEIRRDLSLVDDVFPNLQLGPQVPGEWTHINSGLFSADVLARLGGFENCIEEDRELRNRLILSGEIVRVVPDILMTKIETQGSLTQSAESDHASDCRRRDRALIQNRVEGWRRTGRVDPVPVELPSLAGLVVGNPQHLSRGSVLMSPATRRIVEAVLRDHAVLPAP